MRSVAVVGAGGFVGAGIVRGLAAAAAEPIEVHAIVVRGTDTWRLEQAGCAVHEVASRDAADAVAVLAAIGPDAVVNAAAHGAYSYQHDLDAMLATNVGLVSAIVDWCVHHDVPLVHLGSSSEYGAVDHAPAETDLLRPNSTYAVTKAAGTHLVADACRRRGLRGVVLRLYSVYGPWEEPGRLMPTLAVAALAGRLPPLVDPRVARDFVHVDDVVAAVRRWLDSPVDVGDPAVLNIGSGRQVTLGELVEVVRELHGISATPAWGSMPNRRWDTDVWVADARRAAQVIGWTATVPLETGLTSLTAFVAEHLDRYAASPTR